MERGGKGTRGEWRKKREGGREGPVKSVMPKARKVASPPCVICDKE